MKHKKHRGFSFYDVIISLIILTLASVYVTKIFVGSVELNKKNEIIAASTFEAIETIETIKSIGYIADLGKSDFFNSFQKQQNGNSIVYTRNFKLLDRDLEEVVYIEVAKRYEVEKIKFVNTENIENIKSEKIANILYNIRVEIYDEYDEEIYSIDTYFAESRKVLN